MRDLRLELRAGLLAGAAFNSAGAAWVSLEGACGAFPGDTSLPGNDTSGEAVNPWPFTGADAVDSTAAGGGAVLLGNRSGLRPPRERESGRCGAGSSAVTFSAIVV